MTSPNTRLYIKIANAIIDKIKARELNVGDRIPPERKLAEMYDVSRTVVREAMVCLELTGVARIQKGSGVYVTSFEPKAIREKESLMTPFEILDARKPIEAELARRAAEFATDELVDSLLNCLKMMEASNYFSEEKLRKQGSVDADRQFHLTISSASNNPLLTQFHKELMDRHMDSDMWAKMDEIADEPAARGLWIDDHRKIYMAIKNRNQDEAYKAMYNHINNVINEIT